MKAASLLAVVLCAAPASAGSSVAAAAGSWRDVSKSNLVPAGSRGPNPAFEAAFDCAARTLAIEFAFALQPERPPSFFASLADALNGTPEKAPNCTVSVPPAVAAAAARNPPMRFRQQPLAAFLARAAAGNTFYVNATGGSDANPGTEAAPFATIPAAVAAARAAPGWDTIVLRAGTHYLTATVALTAADSGLQFTSAPGEEAWVSGAVPVTAAWQAYNVTPGGPQWVAYDNVNAVYAGPSGPGQNGPGEPCLGQHPDAASCKAACIAYGPSCRAYTWHDNTNGEYSLWCWGVTSGAWNPVNESGHFSGHLESPPNVWVASMAGFPLVDGAIKGLRWNGGRLQRARYPNANSEFGFQSSLQANWTPQQTPRVPDVEVNLPTPVRNTTVTYFKTFTAGIGGTCARFSPPAGYWCSTKVQGGGSVIWYAPIAMDTTQATLPHTPYANARGGLIMTWRPGHWASWMAEIGDNTYDPATGASNFSIAYGLFQGSRGEDKGDEIYIENVFEELDAPGEWFYNETTQLLYLWHNATGAPPSDGSISAATVKHLFNVTGTLAAPVTDVSFLGIGFRDTSYTYMDPHGIPSGGDWTLERSAVVFAEGTERFTVSGCVFERVDGNALLLSAYTREASITDNEFAWIGAVAVALWGNTDGGDSRLPYGLGQDGTSGDQPRGTVMARNYVHDYGIWNKQSSAYTQFKSSESRLYGNVFTNGPRAHINHNDGFRGGGIIESNLLMNSCRESSDHGPFNSWDRDPYVFDLPDGTVGTTRMYDSIRHNLVFANYYSLSSVDNDDGSSFYNITGNVQLYGDGGLKNDFEGHDGHALDNMFVFVRFGASNGYAGVIGQPGQAPLQLPGHVDSFINNTVYMTSDNAGWGYANVICDPPASMTVIGSNEVYTPTGNVSQCGVPLAQWQAQGHDVGTTVAPASAADVSTFIARARSLLARGPGLASFAAGGA